MADQVARLGPLHGLVNNAALANGVGGTEFQDIELDVWDRLMAVNARGPWLVAGPCCRNCLRTGRAAGS